MYFTNLAAFTPQNVSSMFDHFSTICMKEFRYFKTIYISVLLPRVSLGNRYYGKESICLYKRCIVII